MNDALRKLENAKKELESPQGLTGETARLAEEARKYIAAAIARIKTNQP